MMTREQFEQNYQTLKQMRFSGMANELKRQFEDLDIEGCSADERITKLIEAENETRRIKKILRLTSSAGLKYRYAVIESATLENQGISRSVTEALAEGSWIDEAVNLLITGKTGTGKSYLACALAISAARKFKTMAL